ncbi:putative NAD dependent epimerase/dehydratase [Xylaria sp. FL0064]|nr:putative NAD dependent epimerase/dehydratase [Xylaria sp. FL0064]
MSASKQQRLFITGASGFIGSRVTEFAIREGYTVHGLCRTEAKAAQLRALGAVPVKADMSALDILRSEAAQADIVVHLADAWIDDFSQPYDDVVRIDGAAVDAMAEGLAQSKSARKLFLGTSGVGVARPDPDGGETDEDAPPDSSPINGRIRCENHVLSKAGFGGIKVCVMRLSPFVYGHGGSGVALFMGMFAKLGAVVRIGDGRTQSSVVHVDDAARAYVLALERACVQPGKDRVVYNIASTTEVSFRDFTDAMADVLGIPVREMDVAEAAKFAGPLAAGFFSARIRGKGDRAKAELGWKPCEIGLIEDIRKGSYLQVAKELVAASGKQA